MPEENPDFEKAAKESVKKGRPPKPLMPDQRANIVALLKDNKSARQIEALTKISRFVVARIAHQEKIELPIGSRFKIANEKFVSFLAPHLSSSDKPGTIKTVHGITAAEVAQKMGVSSATVSQMAKRNGIHFKKGVVPTVPVEKILSILAPYVSDAVKPNGLKIIMGITATEIGERVGFSRRSVADIAKKHGFGFNIGKASKAPVQEIVSLLSTHVSSGTAASEIKTIYGITATEIGERVGFSRRTVADIAKKHGFRFLKGVPTKAPVEEIIALLKENVPVKKIYELTGVARGTIAQIADKAKIPRFRMPPRPPKQNTPNP